MATRTPLPPNVRTPPPRRNWRSDVRTASGLNVLMGIWLIVSPFVLAYQHGDAAWDPIVFGIVVLLLALARVSGAYWDTWMSWVNAGIGLWLFASGFWLADSARAEWNSWLVGALVFLFAASSASASQPPPAPRQPLS